MSCSRDILLPVEGDEAWDAVVDAERWLADEADVDLREGGAATFVVDGEQRSAIVEEVVDGERWSFWWWTDDAPGSRVTVELTPAVGGTRVRVTESPAGPWAHVRGRAPRALAVA